MSVEVWGYRMNGAVVPVVARQEGSGFHSHSVCLRLLREPLWVFCGLLPKYI